MLLELRSLIDNSNNGGIVVDLDGRIVFENSCANVLGVQDEEQQTPSLVAAVCPPPRFATSQIRIRKLIALIPMVTGSLSFFGSSYIVYSLVALKLGRTKKLKTTFNRLLLALSISDMISSFATCLSHWVFPKEEFPGIDPEWHEFTFPYASGTNNTCSFQVRQISQIVVLVLLLPSARCSFANKTGRIHWCGTTTERRRGFSSSLDSTEASFLRHAYQYNMF